MNIDLKLSMSLPCHLKDHTDPKLLETGQGKYLKTFIRLFLKEGQKSLWLTNLLKMFK